MLNYQNSTFHRYVTTCHSRTQN